MKTSQYMLALALAAVPYGAYAQSSVSNAIFNLTETYTAPALPAKDEVGKPIKDGGFVYENDFSVETPSKFVNTYEYGSKMVPSKISNKEILGALLDADVIDTITGWSIVLVNNDQDTPKFAITKGTEYILLDTYIQITLGDASAEAAKESDVTTTIYKGEEEITTERNSSSSAGKDLISIDFNINNTKVNLSGIASWSGMLKTFGKGEDAFTHWIDGPIKINSISGSLHEAENTDSSVIEGSISTAAAKLVDL